MRGAPHGGFNNTPRRMVVVRSFSSFSGRGSASKPQPGVSSLAVSFFLGVTAGATVAYTHARNSLKRCNQPTASESSPAAGTTKVAAVVEHEALTHGWPLDSSSIIHEKSSYACAFDGRTRNPRWVIEKITPETLNGPGTRKRSDFHEDNEVSWKHRSALSDYRGSGYDRGHLVAAADQKGSQEDMDSTFSLSNISPQVGDGFNRDYWAKLEQFVRDVVQEKSGRAAYVATGPLFLPAKNETAREEAQSPNDGDIVRFKQPKPTQWQMRHPVLGTPPAMMHVPTHFFKVVLVEDDGARVACAAFVLPNAPIPNEIPLQRFVVPLTALEMVSGLEFFKRGLVSSDRVAFEKEELVFMEKIAHQLPDVDKKPALPPTLMVGSLPQKISRSDAETRNAGKRWSSVRHLCSVTSCEIKPSKWDKK
jgi:endonuclease G